MNVLFGFLNVGWRWYTTLSRIVAGISFPSLSRRTVSIVHSLMGKVSTGGRSGRMCCVVLILMVRFTVCLGFK